MVFMKFMILRMASGYWCMARPCMGLNSLIEDKRRIPLGYYSPISAIGSFVDR